MNSTNAQTPSSPKPVLLIRVTNHFDLLWRRCRHRKYEFKGRRFAAAADIEDAVITDSLAFARRDRRYRFSIESTAVAREYLRRHPERLAEMRRLVARGRLHISGAGDNIVDGNMLLGESLVRNFVTGYLWNEKQFGLKTVLATRADAFGNCSQLPQILRGCGVRWMEGIGYSPVVGEYWRGLDGSTVFTGHPAVVEVGRGGGFDNIPPCPACAGTGCRTCRGLGIDRERKVRLNPELDRARLATAGRGLYRVQAEELLPNPELLKLATRWAEAYDVRFVNSVDFLDEVQTKLARVDDPPPASVHPACELNPNNTGCYVSRIKIKQTARRLEYALLGAEALCSVASLTGANYPAARLAELWEGVLLILFHDAITGDHTDPAYTELRELQERLETDLQTTVGQVATALAGGGTVPEPAGDWITVFNPTGAPMTTVVERATAHEGLHDEDGRPVPLALTGPTRQGLRSVCFVAEQVPPLGVRRYRFAPGPALEAAENRPLPEAGTVSISNQYFEITADRQGLVAITDRRTGHLVAAPNGLWRPNEAVFERDEGSPWTTLDPNRPRTGLAAHTTLVALEVTALFQRLRFQCDIPNAVDLWGGRIESTVTLVAGVNRVEFHTRVRWGNFNRRLRIAMPVPFTGHAVYGVPYGQQKRERYQPSFGPWAAATGDWPAVDWAGVEGASASVALLTKGLPSFEIGPEGDGSTILLSVLRSPTIPTYLHQPWHLVMTDYDGMRDEDYHDFDYALTSYVTPFATSDVVTEAEAFNAGLTVLPGFVALPAGLRVSGGNVRLGALKQAEDGAGLVLRLWEYRGQGGTVQLHAPSGVIRAEQCNLLEREGRELTLRDNTISLTLRPWEITSVRLYLDCYTVPPTR